MTKRQSARVSKITDDVVTRSGSCTHMKTVGVKGLMKAAAQLTRHLQRSNEAAEEGGVREVMLKHSFDGNVEKLVVHSYGEVGVTRAQMISYNHHHT